MKRKRKVILIACLIALLSLFFVVAWAKMNGEFYALDRSGMSLSISETARHLFSTSVEDGVMFVSANFSKPPPHGISKSKANQFLKRSSPTSQAQFWTHIDGVGPFGIFTEQELGEVTVYKEDETFVVKILVDTGEGIKLYPFADSVSFLCDELMVFPEGFSFGKWEFRRQQSVEKLKNFSRCSVLFPNTTIKEFAIYGEPVLQERGQFGSGILIYFDSSAQEWRVKKWNQKWPLADWKAILADEGENLLDK